MGRQRCLNLATCIQGFLNATTRCPSLQLTVCCSNHLVYDLALSRSLHHLLTSIISECIYSASFEPQPALTLSITRGTAAQRLMSQYGTGNALSPGS